MRKNKILILALLACLCIPVGAQNTDNGNITGVVVDKWGNPVYGASVCGRCTGQQGGNR